jgi:thiamine-phosphate pyrophosphorylase
LIIPRKPILCYVTDRHSFAGGSEIDRLTGAIRRAAAMGVDWIQIREKDLSAKELLQLTRAALTETRQAQSGSTRIFVNDRLDIAWAARANGVHLGEQSLTVARVKTLRASGYLPEEFSIGASCHSLEAAVAAERDGADYVIFGPVFETPSKVAFGSPQGLEPLAMICHRLRIPVLAIGGITATNAGECFGAGASGIAAIRLFQSSENPAEDVARMRAGTEAK